MKYETLVRIDKILEKVADGNIYAITIMLTAVATPFILISEAWKYAVRKVKGKIYDDSSKEWITKEELAKNELNRKVKNREIPLVVENHVAPDKNDCFYFFEKRKVEIPCDKLAYVESEYCKKLHRFFDDNAEWLDAWQRWHGWDIVEYSDDDIREGMFYPQDFEVFKHGFLWCTPYSSFDDESDLCGSCHYYFEIDPDSEIPIKEQMELFMRKIYKKIDL